MNCRHCNSTIQHVLIDLGFAPPSNAYLNEADLSQPEQYFPLKLYVCDHCWLVQTADYANAEVLFSKDYAYFSSVSKSWLEHAAYYVSMIRERLKLDENSFVIEIAANDGYLLKNFVAAGIPCLGIEPTSSTASAAQEIGISVLCEFFNAELGKQLSEEGRQADLIIGNNVYAHVPDINDFTLGMKNILKSGGTITLEFPHLLRLIKETLFDTIYHEHFSYLSLNTVVTIFNSCGLRVFDVEKLPTHGGSLRVYGCHADDPRQTSVEVSAMCEQELQEGLQALATYQGFQDRVNVIKNEFISFLIEQKSLGKSVAAYGAAAKGNTFLNYAGIKPDLLPYVVDASPSKQGSYLPGSHIPILTPDELYTQKPDWVVILPWNIATEVITQHSNIKEWGGQFMIAVPEIHIFT